MVFSLSKPLNIFSALPVDQLQFLDCVVWSYHKLLGCDLHVQMLQELCISMCFNEQCAIMHSCNTVFLE